MSKIEKFIKALEHTPVLFYLEQSVIVLDRNSKEGYIEVGNEEFIKTFNMEPGSEEFFKRFLLPQELKGHFMDYYIIYKEEEKLFREELKRFIKTV